jgi:hypothetical protein
LAVRGVNIAEGIPRDEVCAKEKDLMDMCDATPINATKRVANLILSILESKPRAATGKCRQVRLT